MKYEIYSSRFEGRIKDRFDRKIYSDESLCVVKMSNRVSNKGSRFSRGDENFRSDN